MAFIMTLNLFLAASAQTTLTATNTTAASQFPACAKNTKYGKELLTENDSLEGLTCDVVSYDERERVCQTFPDINTCCNKECRTDLVCGEFTNLEGESGEDVSSNILTTCMEAQYTYSWWQIWLWFSTWERAMYNTCKNIDHHGWNYSNAPPLIYCCPDLDKIASAALKEKYNCPGTPVIPSTSAPPGINCSTNDDCTEGEKCIKQHCRASSPSTPIIVNCKKSSDCNTNKHKKICKNGVCSAASTVYGLTAALVLMLFAF